MKKLPITLATLILGVGATVSSYAQQGRGNVTIDSTELRNGLYMFKGAGGNIAVSTGTDGVLIVDDQFADMTAKIDAAIADITKQPVRYVLNTHWHFDHTGGNEHYGKAGKTIIAHDNARARMSTDQEIKAFDLKVPAAPKDALPVITFNDQATVHFNDLDIKMIHVADAHTDTDAFVQFTQANVIHSGDVYVSRSYLFIDTSSGGSINGVISAIEKLVAISNNDTIIIPGHGELASRADAMKTLAMLKGLKSKSEKAIADGKSLEQYLETNPSVEYDADFQQRDGQGKSFAESVFKQLSN